MLKMLPIEPPVYVNHDNITSIQSSSIGGESVVISMTDGKQIVINPPAGETAAECAMRLTSEINQAKTRLLTMQAEAIARVIRPYLMAIGTK